MIASVESMLLGALFSITWRLYFENELSNILKIITDTLDVLKNFSTEVKLKKTIFWMSIVGEIMHCLTHLIVTLRFFIKNTEYHFIQWASNLFFMFIKIQIIKL